jgi:peroxiredoxin
MATIESMTPLQPGEQAPDFTLPRLDREGIASLADYRGKSPLFLALYRGFWCGACRRAVVRLGLTQEKLRSLGIETLGVVATSLENARLYLRFHPLRAPLAADPELMTHSAYGLPEPEPTPEYMQLLQTVRINPNGELPGPLPILDAFEAIRRLDGFEPRASEKSEKERHGTQRTGQFLIDRDGVIRWVYIECAKEGVAGLGKHATDEEILAEARQL